jgi:hypothetical protein
MRKADIIVVGVPKRKTVGIHEYYRVVSNAESVGAVLPPVNRDVASLLPWDGTIESAGIHLAHCCSVKRMVDAPGVHTRCVNREAAERGN